MIAKDFKTPLSMMDRSSKQDISKTVKLNNRFEFNSKGI